MTASSTNPVFPSLDQPYYGIGPVAAVKRFFQKYSVFSGRASRSEYWWVTLIFALVFVVIGVLTAIIGASTRTVNVDGTVEPGILIVLPIAIGAILGLATIVPFISLTVRRLHDANFSGYLYFVNFVPYVGSLVLLVLSIMPPNPLGARFDAGATTVAEPAQPTA